MPTYINTNRVKGKGIGKKAGFPTINIHIDKNYAIDNGLHFCIIQTKGGWDFLELACIMNVSELNGYTVGEIHVPGKKVDIEPDETFGIHAVMKLRDGGDFKDRQRRIEEDLELFSKVRQRSCVDCGLCYSQDFGYSNYTVEGTDWGCFADEHGEGKTPFARLGKNAATVCDRFLQGQHWDLDVDGYEPKPTDDQIAAMVREAVLANLLDPI